MAAYASLTSTTGNACADGYFLKADKTACDACGFSAKVCTSATAIKTCLANFHLVGGICYSCDKMTTTKSC